MPTKINTWGRGDPVYNKQTWDDTSSSTYSEEERRKARQPRPEEVQGEYS